jgi:hypothetical protein
VLAGCSNNNKKGEENATENAVESITENIGESTAESTIEAQEGFTLTVSGKEIAFDLVAESLTVDWGDGTTDTFAHCNERWVTHTYKAGTPHTITALTENLTLLSLSSAASREFGYVFETKSFDVSRCPALTYLQCDAKHLSVKAINAIFNNLPVRKDGDGAITLDRNPYGDDEYDASLATKKGWALMYPHGVEDGRGDDGDYDEDSGLAEQFAMTTSAKTVRLLLNTKSLNINWGDGTTENYEPDRNVLDDDVNYDVSERIRYTLSVEHTYSDNLLFHTIMVAPETLTQLKIRTYSTDDKKPCASKLDMRLCPDLTHLLCRFNELIGLDISGNTKLEVLNCGNTELKQLDVSHNPKLKRLSCAVNQLKNLDVSRCPELTYLNCNGNRLSATALNALFEALPETKTGKISIIDNPHNNQHDKSIAINKGWNVVEKTITSK